MIDAARIREVLAPFVALANFYGSRDGKDVIYTQIEPCRKAAALFRDLDAQGAAPAGWPPREATEEMIAAGWIDKEDVSPREIWQSMWDAAPAYPAHVLDPPTVEAEHSVSVDKTDAWDEEHIKRRSIIQTPEGFKAIDRETTRPLSEWSDDELHKRGWLPWHGSEKAPGDERALVEVRLRDGRVTRKLQARDAEWRWNIPGRNSPEERGWEIIAYRPVPAKAEPTAADAYCDDPHTERMAAIRRELTRAEPAADAGEVERQEKNALEYDRDGWKAYAERLRDRLAALRPAPSEEQVERAARKRITLDFLRERDREKDASLHWQDCPGQLALLRTIEEIEEEDRAILASVEVRPGERG